MQLRSPATARNMAPIAAILEAVLPAAGTVLEVASGAGEHALHFAARFPDLAWQPSDPDPSARASIAAYVADAKLPNLRAPLALNAAGPWPVAPADALVCINMVHISPWVATAGLLENAGRMLAAGAPLILYGPYRRAEVPTAPSNEAFDASLKARNPAWGLRSVEEMVAEAAKSRLHLDRLVEMPANNLMLVFRKG